MYIAMPQALCLHGEIEVYGDLHDYVHAQGPGYQAMHACVAACAVGAPASLGAGTALGGDILHFQANFSPLESDKLSLLSPHRLYALDKDLNNFFRSIFRQTGPWVHKRQLSEK
mgnify:CR=1 FL=1